MSIGIRLQRKGKGQLFSQPQSPPLLSSFFVKTPSISQDGYTMETLDIHGINAEGVECVIIRNVSDLCCYTIHHLPQTPQPPYFIIVHQF